VSVLAGAYHAQAGNPVGRLTLKKIFLLVATTLLSGLSAAAQNTPAGEVYGGYQFTRIDTHAVQDELNLEHTLVPSVPLINFGTYQNLNGWNFGGQENTNSWFGGVVDVSVNYGTRNINATSVGGVSISTRTKLRSYSFTGGPQFTLRRSSRFQPFARALFGGAWYNDSTSIVANNVQLTSDLKESDKSLAIGGGAGTDMSLSRSLGIRIAVDYIRTFLFNDAQNDYRASVGLVYRFGNK
jgi:opacity protein-like surface antigen